MPSVFSFLLAASDFGEGLDRFGGILGLIHLVLFVIALISILAGRGSLMHKLMWTLVVLLLPLIGLILYFVFGRSSSDA